MNKEVSIVIPTFNRANYLIECIDSCLAQTKACEIIVCDHGSTDNTPEVVKIYGNKIKYVRRELDSGVHFCWMDGILHATNDLIHINFDDDWIEPTFIEECLNLFSDNVGCILTQAKVFFENENRYSDGLFKLENETGIFPVKKLLKLNLKRLTSPAAGIFRKKILIDNLFIGRVPFSKNEYHGVGPDLLFSVMSCFEYEFYGYVDKPLAIFRSHENSITIDAQSDRDKTRKISNAYNDARIYYYINKIIKKLYIYLLIKKFIIKKKY
jgi:glycosyltransferase involved in cell wall biosynthesis